MNTNHVKQKSGCSFYFHIEIHIPKRLFTIYKHQNGRVNRKEITFSLLLYVTKKKTSLE